MSELTEKKIKELYNASCMLPKKSRRIVELIPSGTLMPFYELRKGDKFKIIDGTKPNGKYDYYSKVKDDKVINTFIATSNPYLNDHRIVTIQTKDVI